MINTLPRSAGEEGEKSIEVYSYSMHMRLRKLLAASSLLAFH